MEYAANSLAALFAFLPVDPASAKDFDKSIFYFPSCCFARRACNLIRALALEHLRKCFYAFTAIYSEEYKETVMEWFHQRQVQWLFCMDAAGMGCDIPDIVWAIVYGMQEMCTAFQKGGRAGRRSDIAAKMVWLVEDWAFNKPADYQATSAKAKNEEERCTKMDPAS